MKALTSLVRPKPSQRSYPSPDDMPAAWGVVSGTLVDLTRWDVLPGERAAALLAPNRQPEIVTMATSNELGPRDRWAWIAMPVGRLKVYVLGRVIGGHR